MEEEQVFCRFPLLMQCTSRMHVVRQMVKWGEVCTFGFMYVGGPVARPGDGLGGVQKAKSAKNGRNHSGLSSMVI